MPAGQRAIHTALHQHYIFNALLLFYYSLCMFANTVTGGGKDIAGFSGFSFATTRLSKRSLCLGVPHERITFDSSLMVLKIMPTATLTLDKFTYIIRVKRCVCVCAQCTNTTNYSSNNIHVQHAEHKHVCREIHCADNVRSYK